jgi:hypothetical protein
VSGGGFSDSREAIGLCTIHYQPVSVMLDFIDPLRTDGRLGEIRIR